MKTKRFKIIAVVCAVLFTVTLAFGIIFACLPKERRVESAVPLADTTTSCIWDNSALVEYADCVEIGVVGNASMVERYRATNNRYTFEASGTIITDNAFEVLRLIGFAIMSIEEMQSEGWYDRVDLCPVYVLVRDENGSTIKSQPLFDCIDWFFVFGLGDEVPYCMISFFEWATKNTTQIFSRFYSGQSNGYANGYRAGVTDGANQSYSDGYDAGYSAGHSYGQSQGYDNGYEEGLSQGRSDGLAQGYKSGYTEGYNKGSSEKVVNPLSLFLEPVHKFMNTPFFGDLTYASVFNVILFVAVATIFIKMFGGG